MLEAFRGLSGTRLAVCGNSSFHQPPSLRCERLSRGGSTPMSSTIEKSIEVDVPVRVAYNQWTQFEDFPLFMEGIKEVKQVSDKQTLWVAEVGFKEKSWEADIVE